MTDNIQDMWTQETRETSAEKIYIICKPNEIGAIETFFKTSNRRLIGQRLFQLCAALQSGEYQIVKTAQTQQPTKKSAKR